MKPDALLVIDVQTALVALHPYEEDVFLARLQRLITACRQNKVPVIYIRHGEDVPEGLLPGTPGWEIAASIAPAPDEPVVDKHFSSAFRQTDLQARLDAMGAKNLILCGMQTEYCVDTTCRVAFELGFVTTVPQGCTTTFDNGLFTAKEMLTYYERMIWDGRFARVLPLEDVLAEIATAAADS